MKGGTFGQRRRASRPRKLHLVYGLMALAIGLCCLTTAQAQETRRAPKVIQLEEIKIEGRVQKPNAFYILNRSSLGYEVMDLRTSFVREVVRSVEREPF